MAKTIIKFDVSEIIKRTNDLRDTIERGATAVCQKVATDSESDMKTNAPWTDQTSNARNGLKARAVIGGNSSFGFKAEYAVVLFHTMPYGIWLEVRNSGKYAIILPVLQRQGPRAMNLLSKILHGGAT